MPGTANTRFSGTQSFTVDAQVTGTYRLREAGRGSGIETYDLNTSTVVASSTDYTNTSSSYTFTNIDQVGTDAHWGAEMVYDYYLSAHSRNSIDGAGMKMIRAASHNVQDHDGAEKTKGSLLLFRGLLVGMITGMLGIGGGFLIVPALYFCAKLPMKTAIGTTLLIITINSLIGFFNSYSSVLIDWSLLTRFLLTGLLQREKQNMLCRY
jgi:hypothetical protein